MTRDRQNNGGMMSYCYPVTDPTKALSAVAEPLLFIRPKKLYAVREERERRNEIREEKQYRSKRRGFENPTDHYL